MAATLGTFPNNLKSVVGSCAGAAAARSRDAIQCCRQILCKLDLIFTYTVVSMVLWHSLSFEEKCLSDIMTITL